MSDNTDTAAQAALREEVRGSHRNVNTYAPGRIVVPSWVFTNPEAA